MLRDKKRLGEMLLEANIISQDLLLSALKESREKSLKLGEYLINSGFVREGEVLNLLSVQLGISRYTPKLHHIAPEASSLLPLALAQRHKVAPLSLSGHLLQIAINDPLDITALDAVEISTNFEVDPVICSSKELEHLLSSIYGMGAGIGQMLAEIDQVDGTSGPVFDQDSQDLASIQDMVDDAPVVKIVNTILGQAVRENASDVHLSPEKDSVQLRFRIDGKLRDLPSPPKAMFLAVVSRFKIMSNMDISVSRMPQDGRFSFKYSGKEIHVRASVMPTIHGENLVLRVLDTNSKIYSLEGLGMSFDDRLKISDALKKPYGLILATGPTGSGKSTCLYSLLSMLNSSDSNIVTLEDPVEYRLNGVRQAQLNRKAGMTFASGLRSILRQDPNIIMVGEIRDAETASIAIQAGMTGHLVLSTLHTNDAAGAITRLIDMGIEPFLVSSVLLACIGQRLIRTICPECKEAFTPPLEALRPFGINEYIEASFSRGAKCHRCGDTGYKGRIGIFEVLSIDEEVQEMILRRASSREIAESAIQRGRFSTMKEDALSKVFSGVTTLEEAASSVLL